MVHVTQACVNGAFEFLNEIDTETLNDSKTKVSTTTEDNRVEQKNGEIQNGDPYDDKTQQSTRKGQCSVEHAIISRIAPDISSDSHTLSFTEDCIHNGGQEQNGDLRQDGGNRQLDIDKKFKFHGAVYRSFRKEKRNRRKWRRLSWTEDDDEFWTWSLQRDLPELSRSQYSLVSCAELTPAAVELWHSLPEEVKYDPALAQFRNIYEKEHGTVASVPLNNSRPQRERLPLVSSAPHLNNNLANNKPASNNNNNNVGGLEMGFTDGKRQEAEQGIRRTQSKMARAGHFTKLTVLLAAWVFFTLMFLMYNEKEEVIRQSSVAPGEVKDYFVNASRTISRILITLRGPFLSEQSEKQLNSTLYQRRDKMDVWIETSTKLTSPIWTLILEDPALIDFSTGETRSKVLQVPKSLRDTEDQSYTIKMRQDSEQIVPFTFSYEIEPFEQSTGVIFSCLLLCALYALIIFEIINRTMAAVIVSTTSLAVLSILGARPSLPELISWLDMETLLLLFSMMLLVAIMAETGMFDFLAVFTFEVTKGKMWPLINLLSAITALLSTFLDNVTTVLLMTPVTIRLCEVMELDPVPILMSMVLYSNIGGTATPVGDPPNVIIASNKAVIGAGINFTNFTMHMTFGILLVCVQTYLQLRFIYRDTNKLRLNVPRDIQELRQQIAIWRRAADSLPLLSQDQHVVKERLNRKVYKLEQQLRAKERERAKRACPKSTFQSTLDEMKDKYKIRDKPLLLKSTIAITFVVAVFFLHSIPELNRVSLGWTALLGALLLLILADREDLEPILHRVEWSTLLFFAALFVLMEALSKLGLISFIGRLTERLILSVPDTHRLGVALLLMLWVSGVTSAFVDNIPLTTMMVRIVTSLGNNPNIGLPMAPLIWALSFGACLGGNGTLIGASANVVCAGVAEQHGYRISFMRFFKVGFPVMLGHLVVASVYLMICHCMFEWH